MDYNLAVHGLLHGSINNNRYNWGKKIMASNVNRKRMHGKGKICYWMLNGKMFHVASCPYGSAK